MLFGLEIMQENLKIFINCCGTSWLNTISVRIEQNIYPGQMAHRQGVAYLKKHYPAWEQWMDLRKKMDPLYLFLTDYCAEHLFNTKSTHA